MATFNYTVKANGKVYPAGTEVPETAENKQAPADKKPEPKKRAPKTTKE